MSLRKALTRTPTLTGAKNTESSSVEETLKSINEAADPTRNLFVTYIILAVYIMISVGSTTDEQLLNNSSVAVPFLSNVNLPVSAFYQLIPWFFLFLHLELLLQFQLLSDKLHTFNHILKSVTLAKQRDLRMRLANFPFSHLVAGDRNDNILFLINLLVVWISIFVLPVLVLISLQLGFLPYHSDFTTLAHRLVILIDCAALIFFWPRFINARRIKSVILWRYHIRKFPEIIRKGVFWYIFFSCAYNIWTWYFDESYFIGLFDESENHRTIEYLFDAKIITSQVLVCIAVYPWL